MKKTFLYSIAFILFLSGFVLGQQPLDYDLEVDIKNIASLYVNDGSIFTYDIYYHNNGSQTINDVVLSTSLHPFANIISASQSGNTISATVYGLAGDVCLPDLYNSTGHYMDILDQWAVLISDGGVDDFSILLDDFLQGAVDDGYITIEQKDYWVAHPGEAILDLILPIDGITLQERFDEIGIVSLIQDGYITIDPSCGTAGSTLAIERGLGSILPGGGGYISIYAQLLQNTTSTIEHRGTSSSDTTIASSVDVNRGNGAIYRTFTNTANGTASLFFNKSGGPLLFNNQTILDSVIDESMTEQEKAIAIWQLVKDYTFNYPGLADDDNHRYRDSRWMNETDERDPVQGLNTLYSMCGEINGVFASLLDMAGLQAVRAELSGHIATEVLIDGQWAFMDADGGAYWTNGSGRIYGVTELGQDPSIMYDNLGDYPPSYADAIASSGDNSSDRGDVWTNSDHTMLVTLLGGDTISYGYYQDWFGWDDEAPEVLYAEGTVTRATLHDSMLSGVNASEFSFVEYIPYLPISFELSTDISLEDDVFVYLKEQYTDSEVSLGRLHNRLVYNLNETQHSRPNQQKHNYSYTLRFVCPSGCDIEDLSSRVELETTFIFNHLALPHDSDLDMIFSGSTSAIDVYIEHNTKQKVMFSASITGDQADQVVGNDTQTVGFNTLDHGYAILPMSGGLLADVLAYKGYSYGSGLSLFGEEAFVGQVGLDLHNTLTMQNNIIMTDESESIQVFLHSGVVITPSGNSCGNEFLLAPQDMTDLSGSTAAMTFVVGSACSGRTLSFSEPVRIRVALANNVGDTIVAQVSADRETRSSIDATRIDDNTVELLAPHFSTFHVSLSSDDEESDGGSSSEGSNGNGGGLSQDICSDEDLSGSYYDGECDDNLENTIDEVKDEIITETLDCDISQELLESYTFSYGFDITTVADVCQADMYGSLIRKHMAKFLSMFAVQVLKMTPDTTRVCEFTDMKNESFEMQGFARMACQLGIMGLQQDGTPDTVFNPNQHVTRAMFGTALSRLLYGDMHNIAKTDSKIRYAQHLNALQQEGIMTQINTPNTKETRGYVMLMLMRAYEGLQ